jgi:hypothetical protein
VFKGFATSNVGLTPSMLVERLKKIGRALAGDAGKDQAVTAPESGTKVDAVNENPAPPPKAAKRPPARNSNPGVKKFRLSFRSVSEEDLSAMAAQTLHDGGDDCVAPPPREPEAGEKMPDGSVFAGISPDSGKPIYAMPQDAPQPMKWDEAMKYAKDLDAHGHQDWRLPTKGELNVLFNNRAAIGGFNVTGSYPEGWYWSASEATRWYAWVQRFSDGSQNVLYKITRSAVRCVR